mmetsp:Transcript_33914/g.39156  ORF Transcript_33914/g.39156 Transcript_33914/m.39156 type:complete len:259 (+) Transcript_33914:18-794(+)
MTSIRAITLIVLRNLVGVLFAVLLLDDDVLLALHALAVPKVVRRLGLAALGLQVREHRQLLGRRRSVHVLAHVLGAGFVGLVGLGRQALGRLLLALLLTLALLARSDVNALRPLARLRGTRWQPVAALEVRGDRPALGLALGRVVDLDHVLVDVLGARHAGAPKLAARGQSGVGAEPEVELPGAGVEVVEQQVLGLGVVGVELFFLHLVLVDLDPDLLPQKPVELLRPRYCEYIIILLIHTLCFCSQFHIFIFLYIFR